MEEEIWRAINEATAKEQTLGPEWVKALNDPLSGRRAVAGWLLARRQRYQSRVHPLLKDPAPVVRLRVAQGLMAAKDTKGIPVLIDLLQERSLETAWQAEELLHWLAGTHAPQNKIGIGESWRQKLCQSSWQKWWKEKGATVDWTALARSGRPPRLLVIQLAEDAAKGNPGEVALLGCDGKPRRLFLFRDRLRSEIEPQAFDNQARLRNGGFKILPGNRVLSWDLTKGSKNACLIEKDLAGKVLWRSNPVPYAGAYLLLRNGSVFVDGDKRGSWEMIPKGEITRHWNSQDDVLSTETTYRKIAPHGKLIAFHTPVPTWGLRSFAEINPKTMKKERTVPLPETMANLPISEIPQGFLLLSVVDWQKGRVLEINRQGKKVWQHIIRPPLQAARLGNRNTLIAGTYDTSMHPYSGSYLAEITREGKMIREDVFDNMGLHFAVLSSIIALGFDSRNPHLDLASSVPYHLEGLKDENGIRRWQFAMKSLDLPRDKFHQCLPQLLEIVHDARNPLQRFVQDCVIKATGPEDFGLLLKAAKNDPRAKMRALALYIYAHKNPKYEDFAPVVFEAAKDPEVVVRRYAHHAMGVFILARKQSNTVFPIVTTLGVLGLPIDHTWRFATTSLLPDHFHGISWKYNLSPQQIKDQRDFAIRGLEDKDFDPDPNVGTVPQLAAQILDTDRLVDKTAVPSLIKAIQDKDWPLCAIALGALLQVGPEARDALPALKKLLEERKFRGKTSWKISFGAINLLASIGPPARTAIAAIESYLDDDDIEVRAAAKETLRKLKSSTSR
jgi:hypothetical protein